jgi:hypothetical protein
VLYSKFDVPPYFAEPMPRPSAARRSTSRQDPLLEGPIEAIKELTDAWIRKDPRGMSRRLSDDITELGPAFPKPLVGKHNFFEKYQAYFSSSLRIESYRMLSPSLIHLTPQLVLVHFRYWMKTVNRESVEKSSGQESMLVGLRRGRWRVKFIHWHKA